MNTSITDAVKFATFIGDAPAASTPYIAPASILERITFAFASALAGQHLSFLNCCLAFFSQTFDEGAVVGCMSGGQVGTQVSEVRDNADVAVDVFPHRFSKPVPCLFAADKVITLIWCNLGSHVMQIPVCGVESSREFG